MAEEKRNLCAQIPISLHSRVRQEQEASGQTLSEYMTQLITEFYHMKENQGNMNTETRTVAFQVPPELFEEFKAYLQRNHTSSRRSSSWPASSGPWRRSERRMRGPARSRTAGARSTIAEE